MKKNHTGIILNNEKIAKGTYKLVIKSQTDKMHPGQFISILCENKTLRRPFSVCDYEDDKITVLYKIKGEGTNYIKLLSAGEKVDFLGPLGNTFDFDNTNSALLVGAGIGIAPMLFLKKELDKKGVKNFLVTGFREKEEILNGSDKTVIGGSVVDYLDELKEKLNPDIIYSCGPNIVLKLVSEFGIKNNIKTQVSMEKTMACSIGVCRGCVIEINKNGEKINKTVCKDGPVFWGNEVIWQI